MDWKRFGELVALSDSGDRETAIHGLSALVKPSETNEDNASVLLIIGACEKELGRFDRARRTLNRARSLADKDSWIQPRAIFFDASTDMSEGKWRDALGKLDVIEGDYYPLLHRSETQDLLEEVCRKRGMALYELNRLSEARPLLERAVGVEYERAAALYYLGRCCYDLGDLDKARESLEKALILDLHPTYQPSAHYVLGLTYHWRGQNARAISEFEWCLEHDKEHRVAKWKILTGLLNASKALGLNENASRYSKMLRSVKRTRDARL